MATGDSGDTASEVARQVGIGSADVDRPRVVTGAEMAMMPDAEPADRLRRDAGAGVGRHGWRVRGPGDGRVLRHSPGRRLAPGRCPGAGCALHESYLTATTATFVAIVAWAQAGTAMAARSDRSSLRGIGLLTNPMLLWGIAFELVFTAALVYLPVANQLMPPCRRRRCC